MCRHSPRSRLLPLIAAAAGASLPAHADEFSWQLSGAASQGESGDFKSDSWVVDGTYYVNPIDDSDGPYALASFLNPTTRVSAVATKSDPGLAVFPDRTAYTLNGVYVLPGERWYIGANYSKSEGDDTPTETRSDPKGYRVDAGVYLGANTTLELGVAQSKQRVESFFGCPAPPAPPCGPSLAVETTTDAVGFEVFHLRRFRSLTYSLQGSVSESEPETEVSGLPPFTLTLTSRDGPSSRRYAVAGELFPTDRLGVRLGYSTSDVDGFDVDTDNYDVTATWFFKPRVAMELSLGRSTISGASVSGESESAQIRFTGRL